MSNMSVSNLGLKKVSVKIDQDAEDGSIKRTLSLTAEVTEPSASAILALVRQKVTWSVDLHADSIQLPLNVTPVAIPE